MRFSSLSQACALALASLGCGGTLDALPADTVASVYFEGFGPGQGAFASLRLDNGSCLQLPDDTSARFNGAQADEVNLGGRGNNPLAAYFAIDCQAPSASWFQLTSLPEAPFVFELASGEVTLSVELDEQREVTRCDFPSCFSEAPRPQDEP